jgi:hypothetical protein
MKMQLGRRETVDEFQRSQDRTFGEVGAAYQDEDLLRRLGLRVKGYKRKYSHIGTVRLGLNRADVEAGAIPAISWRFTIHRWNAEQPLVVSTGCAPFIECWPFVELLLATDRQSPPEAVFAAAALVLGEGMFIDHTADKDASS